MIVNALDYIASHPFVFFNGGNGEATRRRSRKK